MIRTQIYISENLMAMLKYKAATEKTSVSKLLAEGAELLLETDSTQKQSKGKVSRMIGLIDSGKGFKGTPEQLSKSIDDVVYGKSK